MAETRSTTVNGLEIRGTARFDETGLYRYALTRRWSEGPRVCFVLLNPSTADAQVNDPTVRRCIGYAMDWGAGSLDVVNIFALRSTDPKGLRMVDDPVGPRNDRAILTAARRSDTIVAAWGNHGLLGGRGDFVRTMLHARGIDLQMLEISGAGQPKHPLYLSGRARPVPLPRATIGPKPIRRARSARPSTTS